MRDASKAVLVCLVLVACSGNGKQAGIEDAAAGGAGAGGVAVDAPMGRGGGPSGTGGRPGTGGARGSGGQGGAAGRALDAGLGGGTGGTADAGPGGAAGGTVGTAPATVTSLTKDGITWTFADPVFAGQFVTGDYYVVGPVTITAISPAPTTSSPYLHGSVKNLPTANGKSGFDSRLDDGADQSWWFDASFRSYPPIPLQAGDTLVSARSLDVPSSLPRPMRSVDKNMSPVASYSLLTALAAAPAADAFRPSYCDRGQTLYRASALDRSLLPSLAPPNPAQTPTPAQFETWFRRAWIDTNAFLFDAPAEYMPSYGAQVAAAVGFAALTLTLDLPAADKVNLTNYLVQYGIDLFGCVQAGYGWPGFGGHRSGRKLPILLAGILLGDDAMKNVSAAYPDKFGEDTQTVYVDEIPGGYTKAWQGATVIYGGHYGVHSDGTPMSTDPLYGPYEQLQPAQWPLSSSGSQLGESYRRCCTSLVWVGEALAARLLGAESAWSYPAFFAYVDRWMTEDDTQAIADVKAQSGFDYSASWSRQRQTKGYFQGGFPQYSFVDDMWAKYR
ncbi:MAG: hypothetical protein JXP73_11645 [Deltaproteobacteria bacterium]|nr:hypothetical protein [Deltaproteobacteria bacterium]